MVKLELNLSDAILRSRYHGRLVLNWNGAQVQRPQLTVAFLVVVVLFFYLFQIKVL